MDERIGQRTDVGNWTNFDFMSFADKVNQSSKVIP